MTQCPTPALENVRVLANDKVCTGVGLLALHAPRCASDIRPGQFVHLRIQSESELILRRPFSIWRAYDRRVEILYQVVGEGTRRLTRVRPGDESLDIVGPLGHGWQIPNGATHALVVAAGLGSAPLGMLTRRLAEQGVAVVVAVGANTADRLLGLDDFETVARRVEVATDDGTRGFHGVLPQLTAHILEAEKFEVVYTCGPEIVQRLVAEQAAAAGVSCQVSLERRMACGIGSCLSCVVPTHDGLKRSCVDGPVFNAAEVIWE